MYRMSKNLKNFDKVTIITGGTMGIGEGCARVFTRAGAPVVIAARDKTRGEEVARTICEQEQGSCTFIRCDVTLPEEIKALIDETVRRFGRLDCLINNAGWHPPHTPIDDISIEDFKDLLQLNLVSYFAACKFALPYLRQTKGCIINMGSLVGTMGQEYATIYVATKAGISGFSKALAVDEARNGVRVNVIAPGVIQTPLTKFYVDSQPDPKAMQEALNSWQWNGRTGTIEEVGEACLFLASDGAGFITGIELNISGGAELAYGVKLPK